MLDGGSGLRGALLLVTVALTGCASSPPALDYFRQQGLVIVDLDTQATGSQVVNALCADLARGTSRAVLRDAYAVAAARGRWDFGVDPTGDTQLDACS